jgi:hypothetical protein
MVSFLGYAAKKMAKNYRSQKQKDKIRKRESREKVIFLDIIAIY